VTGGFGVVHEREPAAVAVSSDRRRVHVTANPLGMVARVQMPPYRAAMTLPPRWFYRTVEPQVAQYIGPSAASVWVRSRFWWTAAWILWVPLGLSCVILAQLPGWPHVLWLVTAASSLAGLGLGLKSVVSAGAANRQASAYLSAMRGYRMSMANPVTSQDHQWARALAKAEDEHQAHLRLAHTVGVHNALEQLVRRKRSSQGPLHIALGLSGFLVGFVLGVVIAFAVGQTKSLGVLTVFIAACLAGFLLPALFRSRFRRALDEYRSEVAIELSETFSGSYYGSASAARRG
jgi:hypothetical protein